MIKNIFLNFPEDALNGRAETFEKLLSLPNVYIERIVSTGQSSPPNFWYSQPKGEWVIVLKGSAGLQFEGELRDRELDVGDFIHIPPHCKHRVAWTAHDIETVWLAIHYIP